MGVLIKIDGVTFDPRHIIDTVDIPDEPIIPDEPVEPVYITDYPVKDGLMGLYDLGGTPEDTIVNHANNAAPATLDGTYQVKENYVTFTGKASACRMLTNLNNTLANTVTYVALFSVPAGGSYGNRVIVGCRYAGTNTFNYGLSLLNDRVRFGADNALQDIAYPSAINSNNFAILVLTANSNSCRVVRYINGKLDTLANYSGTLHSFPNNKTQIGGDSSANQYDPANISLAAIHEGVLDDDQLTEICKFVKKYGKQKGLTIE